MSFDNKEIAHIANLAKLALNKQEEEKYGAQIASVLDYVKMLDEIDIDAINDNKEGLSLSGGVSDRQNVWREDEAQERLDKDVDELLSQTEREDSFVKAKRVL